jgi:hypothetical protein
MIPHPATPPRGADLPRPLTFFLTTRQRAAVLRLLRRFHPDRAAALLSALDIPDQGPLPAPSGERPHAQRTPRSSRRQAP